MILHLEPLEVEEQKLQFFPKMQMSCTKKVIPDAEGKHWYTRDEHGVVHRFGNSNDVKVHWNGDSMQNRGIPVPPEVAKRFAARTITCKCKGAGK